MPNPRNKKLHPDHNPQLMRVRRIAGQVAGVQSMIEDRRYCVDIITQIRAARAALKSLEASVLETHMQHCVAAALNSKKSVEQKQKVKELLELFKRS